MPKNRYAKVWKHPAFGGTTEFFAPSTLTFNRRIRKNDIYLCIVLRIDIEKFSASPLGKN
jgi:hypothetical protein